MATELTKAAATTPGSSSQKRTEDQPCYISNVSLQAKIPLFWREHPKIWFAQFEAAVSSNHLTEEQKYNLIIPMLERRDIEQISDIVLNPPENAKYKTLKTRLLSVYEESDSRQLQKLLSGLELGDQKPTCLLRKMRDLAGTMVKDEALKVLWMNQLPSQVRAIISVNTESSLNTLATMADKIMENIGVNEVAAIATTSNISEITLLSKQIEKLTLEIDELKQFKYRNHRSMHRSPFSSRSRSRSKSRNGKKPGDPDWQCYYHYKFGDKARNCQSPCNRKKSEN